VDEGKLVGIITHQDLQQKIPFASFAIDPVRVSDYLTKCPVRQLMTIDPITISSDTKLVDAARLMLERKISTLPVIDEHREGKLVGVITESDIFRAFVKTVDVK
jgi:acetoin utilization protein AcuB